MQNIENTFDMESFDPAKPNFTDTELTPEHKALLDQELARIKEENPDFDPQKFLAQAEESPAIRAQLLKNHQKILE